jgi:hypothetical protein
MRGANAEGLRDVLSYLYDEVSAVRRIVVEAHLDPRRIDFSGPVLEVWGRVLAEVRKQGRMDDLVGVALQEYPGNKDLARVWAAFQREPVAMEPQAATNPARERAQVSPGTPGGRAPTSASVRRLLQAVLVSDSDLDQVCLDHFTEIYRRFTNGMDRVQKVNVLLEQVETEQIVRRLREFDPGAFSRHQALLEDQG